MTVVRTEGQSLALGGMDLGAIASDPSYGTPTYVYDLDGIAREASMLRAAFGEASHLVAYAVKANSAGLVVKTLHEAGCGADVVSAAELRLTLACGVLPDAILFSGVAKLGREIDAAIAVGNAGIRAIQLESVEEIVRVAARAVAQGRVARVSLRVNPEAPLEALDTHVHIATGHDDAKFGIHKADIAAALELVDASKSLSLVGMSTHVGSQLTSTGAYIDAARTLFELVRDLRPTHQSLRFVDTGGGFGIDYGQGCLASPADFIKETRELQRAFRLDDLALTVEPGRALVAAHGVLLATVVQQKVSPYAPASNAERQRRWLMIDAGMNDLLRPALYQAHHRIEVVDAAGLGGPRVPWRVVGPVCESSDDFGEHLLPSIAPQVVAILDAGAYGYTMASRYNGRPVPGEVFVRGGRIVASSSRKLECDWVDDRTATLALS